MSPKPKRTKRQVYYKSESFIVREGIHANGQTFANLGRPSGLTLAAFDNYRDAVFIAQYCERHHGGSFGGLARHAAHEALKRSKRGELVGDDLRGSVLEGPRR